MAFPMYVLDPDAAPPRDALYAIATTTGRLFFSPFDAEGQSVYSSSLFAWPDDGITWAMTFGGRRSPWFVDSCSNCTGDVTTR